jgi:hypothetical protein
MPAIGPIKRRELIVHLRALGFDQPVSGGDRQYMKGRGRKLRIPNPHTEDISRGLLVRSAGAEDLPDARKFGGHQRTDGPRDFLFLEARLGGALALRAGGESLHRKREETPESDESRCAHGGPQHAIVEKDARRVAAEIPWRK